MSRLTHELLADIDKETVDFGPNYDEKRARAAGAADRACPNLLVNGSAGIAVGMATNIPPHNLTEVIDATHRADRRPGAGHRRTDAAHPGPGFPDRTASSTAPPASSRPIAPAVAASWCAPRPRSRPSRNGRETIIVHELPYQVNKARLIEKIAELVKEKKLEGISELRDESDKDGMRIVIEIRRDAMGDVVLNNLFQQTQMQVDLRHQHGGAARRPAAAAEPQGDPRGVHPPPPRSGHPPHHLRAAQGACPRAHPRRPDGRAGQHRRDDRADQDLGIAGRGARAHAGAHAGRPGWSARCCRPPVPMPRVRKTWIRATA